MGRRSDPRETTPFDTCEFSITHDGLKHPYLLDRKITPVMVPTRTRVEWTGGKNRGKVMSIDPHDWRCSLPNASQISCLAEVVFRSRLKKRKRQILCQTATDWRVTGYFHSQRPEFATSTVALTVGDRVEFPRPEKCLSCES